ncbi:MAG TPA: hypothetical protein VFT02_09705 [Pyrinomonadaceae bacterium]|nr:hypothetical protein [Pyrinomonadaceae bacterium]
MRTGGRFNSTRLLQLLYISRVLQTRGVFYIPNQVMTRNHESWHTRERGLCTIWPGFSKLDSVDVGYHIYAYRW